MRKHEERDGKGKASCLESEERANRRALKNRRSASLSRFRRMTNFKRAERHGEILRRTLDRIAVAFKDDAGAVAKLRPLIREAQFCCDETDRQLDERMTEMVSRPCGFSGTEQQQQQQQSADRRRLCQRLAQRMAEKE